MNSNAFMMTIKPDFIPQKGEHQLMARHPLTTPRFNCSRWCRIAIVIANLLMLLPLSARSQNSVSGDIHDFVFDSAQSPYFVEKDIVVPSGTKCAIGAGCVLLFKPFTGLLVEGTLVVTGTPERPVVLTSVNDISFNPGSNQPADAFDWNGVTIAAESNNTVLSNLHVNFSVYGVKSLTPNVTLGQCVFSRNGQFQFTVKDKILDVKDGIPFSYPTTGAQAVAPVPSVDTAPAPREKKEAPRLVVPPPQKRRPLSERTLKIIRYSSLAIGVVGIIGGSVLSAMTIKEKKNVESMGPRDVNPATGRYYEETDDKVRDANEAFTRYRAGCIAGFIVGGAGLAGFGVTFLF